MTDTLHIPRHQHPWSWWICWSCWSWRSLPRWRWLPRHAVTYDFSVKSSSLLVQRRLLLADDLRKKLQAFDLRSRERPQSFWGVMPLMDLSSLWVKSCYSRGIHTDTSAGFPPRRWLLKIAAPVKFEAVELRAKSFREYRRQLIATTAATAAAEKRFNIFSFLPKWEKTSCRA